MKLLNFQEWLVEDAHSFARDRQAAADKKQFDRDVEDDVVQGHLHHKFLDDMKRAKDDFETSDQKISDTKLTVGNYALHKNKQSLGPGQIQKIHPTNHATLHFNTDLKSSLLDGDANYHSFTFHIDDLIPVVGTSDT